MQTPVAVTPSPAAVARFHAVDAVLTRWDYMKSPDIINDIGEANLIEIVEGVFTGWNVTAILRMGARYGIALHRDGLFFALPVLWAARFVRGNHDWDPHSRAHMFSNALTVSASGASISDTIDNLLRDHSPSTRMQNTVALSIEALLLSAPDDERSQARVLVGLRGITPPVGYVREL